MTNLEATGRRIAQLRKQRDMTQDALAAELGISRSALAGIERGSARAGIVTTVAIADYFKVPMDWLLGRSLPVGGPLAGQFIENTDELALLEFWRSLSIEERHTAAKLLSIPAAVGRAVA
jgi:transcriptional regulator with XRE-family HTH domain